MTLAPITVWHAVDGQLERSGRAGGVVLSVPSQPVAVVTSGLTASSVTLSWQPPVSNGGSAVTGYAVSRDGSGGSTVTVGAATLSQQFRGLTASTVYNLSVAAVNAQGTGPVASRTVTTAANPTPVGGQRFPGDPNPMVNSGTLYLGMSLGSGQTIGQFETSGPIGVYHQYWSNVSDLSTPSGPMAKAVQAAHVAGRLPLVSWHVPGSQWAGAANGSLDATLNAWFDWCATLAKPVWWIVNHEPENGDGVASDYRAWMQHIRTLLNAWEAAHGPHPTLVYMGCLMAFTFAGGNGGITSWWPGDGVWDVLGVDVYGDHSQTYQSGDTLFNSNWSKMLAYVQAHHQTFALTEFNWLPDNPNGATEYQQLYDLMTSGSYDCVAMSIFDSGWWVLTDNNGMLSKHKALLKAPKSIHMSDLGY